MNMVMSFINKEKYMGASDLDNLDTPIDVPGASAQTKKYIENILDHKNSISPQN